jgi:SRSO17 transposase
VLADSAYGNETEFREGISALELLYVVGIHETTTVWPPGETPRRKPRRPGKGRPPTRLHRDAEQVPVSVKELAFWLPDRAWKTVAWREGTRQKLKSRFAAVRVRPAHRDYLRREPYPEEWLLMEWPASEPEPTKYWFSTLPAHTKRTALVRLAKHRWIIERDYEELKQELGLGHYEGRGWRGFHHHATLCIAAYGFLVIERTRFSPSARSGGLELRPPRIPPHCQPRGSPHARRTA